VSPRAIALARETLRAMALVRVKLLAGLVLGIGLACVGTGLLRQPSPAAALPGPAPEEAGPQAAPAADRSEEGAKRVDRHGDPLPPGAIARLGTVRFRVPDEVEALAFAPDGKTLAVSSRAGLFLLDAGTGRRIRRLVPTSVVSRPDTGLAFSPDGRCLAGRGGAVEPTPGGQHYKGVMRVWDLVRGGASREYDADHAVWVGWSSSGEPMVVCLEKGALRLDEPASGRSRRFACENLRETELSDLVTCSCVPNGRALAVSDEHGVVHVWDSTTGRPRCTVRPGGAVSSLALSPDGRTLASLNSESVRLWDATTGKALHTVAKGQKVLAALAFTPDGQTLATAGWSDIRFWDVATGRYQGRTQESLSRGPSIAFTPDGRTLATAERDSQSAVSLWDVVTGKRSPQPAGHRGRPHGTAFSADGRRVATGGGLDGTVQVWDLATGEPLAQVRRPGQWVRDIAFSPDGTSLFSTWTDDNLWVCDATTGTPRHAIKLEDPDRPDTYQSAISMYRSADGKTLVAFSYYHPRKGGGRGNMETLITGWDTSTRRQLFRRRRPGWDSWLALSPDARVLAAAVPGDRSAIKPAMGTGPMRLEDVATGALLLTFPTLDGQTWPLAFSPDGRLLASNNSDYKRQGKAGDPAAATGQTLRLWEVATAAAVLVLPAGWPDHAAFSPDGRLLAVAAPGQEILVWDLAHGREWRRLRGFDAEVTHLAFTPDGRRLVSGLTDSTFLVWDVGPPETAPAGKLGAERLAKSWADLASADAPRAFRARWALAAAPGEALPLLQERLRPARAPDAGRLRRWLADLDSDRFEVRDRAQAALEEQGELAEPALREALANRPSPEVRRRVRALLDGLRGPVGQPEARRSLRAVAVLEDIGTPRARQLLEDLAAGAPEARLTREAKASLARLSLSP
jgi:WD40 repeat protein